MFTLILKNIIINTNIINNPYPKKMPLLSSATECHQAVEDKNTCFLSAAINEDLLVPDEDGARTVRNRIQKFKLIYTLYFM